jgi:cardiolipin synthase
MSLSFLPNLLCVVRILLVYPVAHWILQGRYAEVMALFAIAAFTDALDGALAKRFGWTSELGKHLDPLADKVLLVTVFVCLSLEGRVPWLVTALVLLRDLVIAFGALTYRVLFGPVQGNPTAVSKFNTLAQIVFCLAVVSAAAYQWPVEWIVTTLGALVVVSTGVSGVDYVLIYSRRASGVARARALTRDPQAQQ